LGNTCFACDNPLSFCFGHSTIPTIGRTPAPMVMTARVGVS
jgi:hypothetical protein